MGDCFYQQIVAVDSSTDTVPESGASVRRVGDSVGSYLQDSARGSRRRVSDSAGSSSRRGFTDDEIHMLSCSLLSQRRGPRRAFLEATDSSTRRRLIAECKAIHARVQDSCIEYTPEVCWAINAIIEYEDPKGYAILKKNYKSLPEEVKRFYDAFVDNRYSLDAETAKSLLGPYRLVQDDERVTAFLEGGTTQEDALNDVVEEASVAGEELYGDALDALDALSDQATIMAQDFATEVAAMYTNGLGDIVAGQVSGGAEEASEEIVDNPPVEADVESEDDPAKDDDEVVEETTSVEVGDSAPVHVPNKRSNRPVVDSSAKKYAENKRYSKSVVDAAPKHRVANKRVKDSCSVPSLPLPVGSSVQVSYMGNLYAGTISSVGDGSVVVSGLPIEYFNVRAENGAFTGSDADYTFASTDVVVLPADGSPVALDGPSAESEVVVEENTVEEPTSAGGYVPSIMMDDDEKIEDAIGNTPFEQELRGILRDGCVGHEDDDIFDIPLVADFSLHVDGSNPNNISAHVFEGTVDCGGLMIPTGGLSDDEKGILFVDKVTEFIKEKLGPQVFTLVDLDDVFRASDSVLSDDILLKNVEALESILPDVSGGMPKSAVITVLGSDGNFHDGILILEPNPNTDSEVHYTLKGVGRPKQGIVGLNLMDNDGDWRTVAFDLARYLAPRKFNVSDSAVDPDDVFRASNSTTYDDVIRKNIEALESILPDVSGGATKSTDITVLKSDGRFYEGTLVLRPDFNSESNVHYVLRGVGRRMEGNIGLNLMDNDGDWRTVASDLAHYFAPQKFYVSDSAVDFDVDKILSAVQAGVDISNSDSSVGIFYDDGSDYGSDSSVLFVTEEGTDIVPVSEAVGYLSSHLDAFKEAISESADAIGEALGAIGADVVSGDVHIEDAAGDEVSSSVSEEIIEEQGVSETGSPEAIDWGAVGDTCRQWVLDNSFKLAQEPTDANLQTACELLSAGLEVLHLEVRFDPSVPRILCKNQRFIDVRPDGAYVGTVAFFYQTSDSAISKFASDFSDASVQLAHKIYDIPEVSDSAPMSVDGSYVDFESKDGLLRALDAVHAGGDDFRYVRVEDDEDGKFIVAMADTFGRDKKYMSEDGETSDRSEAVRFSDKREAFERLKQLIKDGKITYSLFNTWPEEVMDDDSLLSDAAKQEVLHSIENEIKKALEEKEILVEDSIVVKIDVDRVQDGAPNTFDIPHTASTFRRIRNTKRVLDSVLGVASDVLGERLTPSVYKSLCKSGSRAAKAKVSKVMDSALAMDALDLYCPDIYKRKLSDSYWVCDDVQKVADSFKLDGLSGASGSCLVSTTPFDESLSAGKQVTCFKCGSKSDIYILIV